MGARHVQQNLEVVVVKLSGLFVHGPSAGAHLWHRPKCARPRGTRFFICESHAMEHISQMLCP